MRHVLSVQRVRAAGQLSAAAAPRIGRRHFGRRMTPYRSAFALWRPIAAPFLFGVQSLALFLFGVQSLRGAAVASGFVNCALDAGGVPV